MPRGTAMMTATLVCCACGSGLAHDRYQTTLASLEGTVESSTMVDVRGELTAAIVWTAALADVTAPVKVAQSVRIEPVFPARYELEITRPPPESAIWDTGAGRTALGTLVVFQDEDRDGALHLLGPDDAAAVDRVYGLGRDTILWVEGQAEVDDGTPPVGLSIIREADRRLDTFGTMNVTLTDDPIAALIVCAGVDPPTVNIGPPVPDTPTFCAADAGDLSEVPIGAAICDADARGFTYWSCVGRPVRVCQRALCATGEFRLGEGEPVPDGWRCTPCL